MRRFLATLSLMALLLVQACHPEPFLNVSPTSLSFNQDGGSQTVRVSANYAWTVSVSGSGLTVSPLSGEGEGTVTVTAAPAGTASETTGSITFQSEGLSASVAVKQDAKSTISVGSVTKIPAEGGTFEVDIYYNTDYSVEVESAASSWITFNGTKALSSGKLQFTFAENKNPETRTGKVTVKDKGGKVAPITLTFEQEEKATLIVDTSLVEVPEEGGQIEIPVQYNTEYTVTVAPAAANWISYVETKALTSGKLVFSVAANLDDIRSGEIMIQSAKGTFETQTITFRQRSKIRRILMEIYQKMDGPHWKGANGWGTDAPLREWKGLSFVNEELSLLSFSEFGLKGAFPESIGELVNLTRFSVSQEPGVSGTLPESFRNLVHLRELNLVNTSMTSLPDLFDGMKELDYVLVFYNKQMGGPLPESLGSSEKLRSFSILDNGFTGTIPASWARLLDLEGASLRMNCLSGEIPATILQAKGEQLAWRLTRILQQEEGYGFDISDIDIPGCWPYGTITGFDGKTFTFADVVSQNEYTVYLNWATWCPYSAVLMPSLKEYYENYRQDGLEIIATVWHPENHDFSDSEKALEEKTIYEKGYDQWYNFFYEPYDGYMFICHSVPTAEVYDKNGNILFSSVINTPDPVRHRFGTREGDLSAFDDLIPFLETVLGPADAPVYESTDFSMDGQVLTLQKASVGKGINIVFLGDGYSDKDMVSGGRYETLMKQAMEEFFAIEPYKTFRNRFNVYAVKAVSKHDRIGEGYTTAFGVSFGNGSAVNGNLDKCYEYALKVPGISDTKNLLIPVMVNTRRNAGTAYMSESLQSGVAFFSSFGNHAEAFSAILQHEAGGHGFAFLADEYTSYESAVPAAIVDEYNRLYNAYGWYANVDFTNDPSKIRWNAFLSDTRYKDEVGIYEGGALYATGVWRPSANSMMNEDAPFFNAPSRWAIYKRIMELSGESASFDAFLTYDAVNRSASVNTARPPMKAAANSARRPFVPTAPPVIVRK